jgi:hypothetical protein
MHDRASLIEMSDELSALKRRSSDAPLIRKLTVTKAWDAAPADTVGVTELNGVDTGVDEGPEPAPTRIVHVSELDAREFTPK